MSDVNNLSKDPQKLREAMDLLENGINPSERTLEDFRNERLSKYTELLNNKEKSCKVDVSIVEMLCGIASNLNMSSEDVKEARRDRRFTQGREVSYLPRDAWMC